MLRVNKKTLEQVKQSVVVVVIPEKKDIKIQTYKGIKDFKNKYMRVTRSMTKMNTLVSATNLELYNIACWSIYNDHLLEYDKHAIYWSFITQLITIFTIITTYTQMHICFNQQITILPMELYISSLIQYLK